MALGQMDSLKVGIVGCGNIANLQLRYIKKYIEPENIALCDRNHLRMNWLSEEHRVANTFPDLVGMLEVFKPTVVHVLTPPKTHKDIAIQCMKAGCHVFLEKPMCVSVAEAQKVVDTADKQNRLVCVDHLRLFDPQFLKAKRILESGALGDIVSISTREVENYVTRKGEGLAAKWMQDLPGEIFYDILPHHLSIINAFLPGLCVKGVEYKSDENGTPKELVCILSSVQGSGMIHLSLVGHLENYAKFECTKGVVIADFLNRMTVVRKATQLPGIVDRPRDKLSESFQLMRGTMLLLLKRPDNLAGMNNAIRSFYQSIVRSGNSPIPALNGLIVMKILTEISSGIPAKEERNPSNALPRCINTDMECQHKSRSILVTGATGFIGKKLVNRLLANGYSIRVLIRSRERIEKLNSIFVGPIEYCIGDISSADDVERACKGIETVYHLAAATKGKWYHHLDVTVSGTSNIIKACMHSGVQNLVYVSTIGVLNSTKPPRDGSVCDEFPYEACPSKRGNYASSKLEAERRVRDFMERSDGRRTNVIILRPGIVYGSGKAPLLGIVLPLTKKFSMAIEYKDRILPLVYVENLVDAMLLAANSNRQGIYNVVDDAENISVKDFIRAYKAVTNKKFFVIYPALPFLRAGFFLIDRFSPILRGKSTFFGYNLKAKDPSITYSSKGIAASLGWESKKGFLEGITEAIRS